MGSVVHRSVGSVFLASAFLIQKRRTHLRRIHLIRRFRLTAVSIDTLKASPCAFVNQVLAFHCSIKRYQELRVRSWKDARVLTGGMRKRILEGAGGGSGVPVMAATKDATASFEGGGPLLAFRCFIWACFLRSCFALRSSLSASCLVNIWRVWSDECAVQFSILLPCC